MKSFGPEAERLKIQYQTMQVGALLPASTGILELAAPSHPFTSFHKEKLFYTSKYKILRSFNFQMTPLATRYIKFY